MLFFKKYFLAIGILFVVMVSFVEPALGIYLKGLKLSSPIIIFIFLMSGYQTNFKEVKFNKSLMGIFGGVAMLSLVISPIVGCLIAKTLKLDYFTSLGIITISAMPPTLSSGIVITDNAKGSTLLATLLTIGYNVIATITIPLVLGLLLTNSEKLDTKPMSIFIQLILLVVIPFIIGYVVKLLMKNKKLPAWTNFGPSICIIILMLIFVSSSNELIKESPIITLIYSAMTTVIIHLGMLAIIWYGAKIAKWPFFETKAALFAGGSKSITVAVALLAIIKADESIAIIPCLTFYFLQTIFDAFLAGKLSNYNLKV